MGEARRECLDLALISASGLRSMGTAEKSLPHSASLSHDFFPFSVVGMSCLGVLSQDVVPPLRKKAKVSEITQPGLENAML